MRRAGCLRHQVLVEHLLEAARQELASVVSVQGADHASGGGAMGARHGVELGDEPAHELGRLALLLHEVEELEPRVVVHQDEDPLVAPVGGVLERADDVGVHQAPSVRRLVARPAVGEARAVGLGAGVALEVVSLGERGRCVGGERGEAPQVLEADVQPAMQHLGHLVGGQGTEVRRGVRAVHAGAVVPFESTWRAARRLSRALA